MADDKSALMARASEEEAVYQDIRTFLEQNAGSLFAGPVGRETPLLNSALDSFTVLQLMMFLGERYQFELQEEDFMEEHFATVATLAKRIVSKRRAS
jgi:acyl carrier protein